MERAMPLMGLIEMNQVYLDGIVVDHTLSF